MQNQEKTKTSFVRLTPDKLNILSDLVVDNIENIFDYFSVEYKRGRKFYYGPCPIHEGDGNTNPFNLYYDGQMYRGNWKCRSHGCERTFKKTSIGFVRGLLSKSEYSWKQPGDRVAPFNDTVNWLFDFLKTDKAKLAVNLPQAEKKKFINAVNWVTQHKAEKGLLIPRATYRATKTLDFSSAYFRSRGFTDEIANKYDVAECTVEGKEMSHRLVIPVYDDLGKYIIGVTGRSTFDQCKECKGYHKPGPCPHDHFMLQYKKWRHNKGFAAEDNLFNFWNARPYINDLHSVVLVESPFNVMRLAEAGVHNCVGTFGAYLNDNQLNKLFQTELYTVNLLYDNDEAGINATNDIRSRIERIFHVNQIKHAESTNDIAEMQVQEVSTFIVPQIKNHK